MDREREFSAPLGSRQCGGRRAKAAVICQFIASKNPPENVGAVKLAERVSVEQASSCVRNNPSLPSAPENLQLYPQVWKTSARDRQTGAPGRTRQTEHLNF